MLQVRVDVPMHPLARIEALRLLARATTEADKAGAGDEREANELQWELRRRKHGADASLFAALAKLFANATKKRIAITRRSLLAALKLAIAALAGGGSAGT